MLNNGANDEVLYILYCVHHFVYMITVYSFITIDLIHTIGYIYTNGLLLLYCILYSCYLLVYVIHDMSQTYTIITQGNILLYEIITSILFYFSDVMFMLFMYFTFFYYYYYLQNMYTVCIL